MVGIGPGGAPDRTRRAEEAIAAADVVIGYAPYLERVADLLAGKETVASGMKQEVARCREALARAAAGAEVALVSSGDPGVYGMAGLVLELAEAEGMAAEVEIVPGVTASSAAAARLGAPLMLDYATVSLSDLLVPWEQIEKRLRAVFSAGFVVALYNPRSRSRTQPFRDTVALALEYRPRETLVGVVTAASLPEETTRITTLAALPEAPVDMRSVVLIGNEQTRRSGAWLLTPRGYAV